MLPSLSPLAGTFTCLMCNGPAEMVGRFRRDACASRFCRPCARKMGAPYRAAARMYRYARAQGLAWTLPIQVTRALAFRPSFRPIR